MLPKCEQTRLALKLLTSLTTSDSFFAFIFTGVSNTLVNALFFGLCLEKGKCKRILGRYQTAHQKGSLQALKKTIPASTPLYTYFPPLTQRS